MALYDEYGCVAVYITFTNTGEEGVLPADVAMIAAFQNDVELSPLVPSENTNGYVQVDTKVQSGATTDVVWIFQLLRRSYRLISLYTDCSICYLVKWLVKAIAYIIIALTHKD